jgi:hypothetical protein
MKRELFCPSCADGLKRSLSKGAITDNRGPREFYRFTEGELTCTIRCDWCVKDLVTGESAVAFGNWTEADLTPSLHWEEEFMTPTEGQSREPTEYI